MIVRTFFVFFPQKNRGGEKKKQKKKTIRYSRTDSFHRTVGMEIRCQIPEVGIYFNRYIMT